MAAEMRRSSPTRPASAARGRTQAGSPSYRSGMAYATDNVFDSRCGHVECSPYCNPCMQLARPGLHSGSCRLAVLSLRNTTLLSRESRSCLVQTQDSTAADSAQYESTAQKTTIVSARLRIPPATRLHRLRHDVSLFPSIPLDGFKVEMHAKPSNTAVSNRLKLRSTLLLLSNLRQNHTPRLPASSGVGVSSGSETGRCFGCGVSRFPPCIHRCFALAIWDVGEHSSKLRLVAGWLLPSSLSEHHGHQSFVSQDLGQHHEHQKPLPARAMMRTSRSLPDRSTGSGAPPSEHGTFQTARPVLQDPTSNLVFYIYVHAARRRQGQRHRGKNTR